MRKTMIAALASTTLALGACGEAAEDTTATENDMAEETVEAGNTIVDVASGNDQFSTLVSAVTAANLVETLSGEGPYTVFAPTNDAFAKIDEATLASLLEPEQQADLARILTYHVVPGETMAADLVGQIEADDDGSVDLPTASGGTLSASLVDGNVVLTDANGGTATVVTTDVDASNGVIHVIDTVVMPGS